VVRDLVHAHHGTIHYDSAGNAFVLTLPPASVHRAARAGLGHQSDARSGGTPGVAEESRTLI
jgi:hypothetical protein